MNVKPLGRRTAQARCDTIRLRLLEIGAAITVEEMGRSAAVGAGPRSLSSCLPCNSFANTNVL